MSSAAGELEKILSEAIRWLKGGSGFPQKGIAARTLIDIRNPKTLRR